MKKLAVLPVVTVILAGCSSTSDECESLAEINRQIQQCEALQKQVRAAKGQPVRLQELERRYQKDCIDSRFYKDDHKVNECKVNTD